MCRLVVGLAWEQDAAPVYVKVNETSGNACQRGLVYANPDEGSGLTDQGFAAKDVGDGEVQLVSSACSGMCLAAKVGEVARLAPCASASKFKKEE